MSTLSGIPSKGEKGKSKFQSLDINNLYRGESLEPHQQKSTLPRKHGMQSLGKVPSTRRPPANLPSLKSEHSGNDPAISLVPTGGTGWGNKPGETGATATPTQPQPPTPAAAASPPVASPQAPTTPVAASVPPTVTPPAPTQGPVPIPVQQPHTQQQQQQQHPVDKSWSSIMAGPGEGGVHPPSFLAHQSLQFQQEFPKLSSGDGQVPATGQKGGSDSQYGPGPSLRPQTEGSWIQGGGRVQGAGPGPPRDAGPAPGPPAPDMAGGRNSSGQSVPPGQPLGPAGQPPIPHQFRGLIPQFMYRGNFPGGFPQNFPPGGPMAHGPPRPRFPYPPDARFMPPPGRSGPPNLPDLDEIAPRPIIKEEELSKMDDIARDPGWATHDDIDYNQKLAFSDDEDAHKEEETMRKDRSKEDKRPMERETRETESSERDDRRDVKRPEPTRPDQRERGWQQGRPVPSAEFRGGLPGPPHGGPPHGVPPHQGPPHQGPTHGGPPHGTPPLGNVPIGFQAPAPRTQPPQGQRAIEDEEKWCELRRKQSEAVSIAVERAKQRKEEEEKRYEETKQNARQKLQLLEQRMEERARMAESMDHVEEPPSVSIPLPEWEKGREIRDKESRERDRSRTSSEGKEDKAARDARDAAEFRQLTQMGSERSAFLRTEAPGPRTERDRDVRTERDRDLRVEREREVRPEREIREVRLERDNREVRSDRDNREVRSEREVRSDRDRPHEQPVFSRQFQSNLPPRFQKQHAERNQFTRPVPSQGATPPQQPNTPPGVQSFDPRWAGPVGGGTHPGQMHYPPQQPAGANKPVGHLPPPPRRNSETERDREQAAERPPSRDQRDRDQRDRRDRHTPEAHPDRDRDRYRHAPNRDVRTNYADPGRKQYYEGSEYQRPYGRVYDQGREEPDRQSREWERERHYDDRREVDNKDSYDRQHQQDTFEERDPHRDVSRQESGGEWRDTKDWKPSQSEERDLKSDRPGREQLDRRDDRPQRPDSRDSRTSRESRNSRDSAREDKQGHDSDQKYKNDFSKSDYGKNEFSGSWADSPFEPQYDAKEEKKKTGEYFRGGEDRGRHAPGPITREKLEASELRGRDTKQSLTQLRRGNAGPSLVTSDKKDGSLSKLTDAEAIKKDRKPSETSDVWNRNTQQKSTEGSAAQSEKGISRSSEPSKSWADSLPDTDQLTKLKPLLPPKEEPKSGEEKKQVDKKDAADVASENLDKQKSDSMKSEAVGDSKREEGVNMDDKRGDKPRPSSRSRADPARPSRQGWATGGYPVHRGGWGTGPPREQRGRRGGPRAPHRPQSSRGQDWGRGSESEYSGDEISGSTESGKEDAGRAVRRTGESREPRRSPKGVKKVEKDDRNRDMRRDGEKGFQGQDSRRYDKRSGSYESGRGAREGFAPRGEPSRRGRGGFRSRGTVARRMDGYGPPPSKSPFGSSQDEKPADKDGKENRKNMDGSSKEDLGGEIMSAEDKIKLKHQATSAGVIGSGARHQAGKVSSQVPPRLQRKSESDRRDSSRNKRGNSGNRTSGRDAGVRSAGQGTSKHNLSDHGDECWETTSENSELDDRDRRQDVHNGRKPYGSHQREPQNNRRNAPSSNSMPRSGRGSTTGSAATNSSRAPGAEKRSNNGYNSSRDRNNSGSAMGGAPNGRGPNRGPNQGAPGSKVPMKEGVGINRLDEIKLADPSLVTQALTELNTAKKSVRPEKEKTNALEGIDLNNYASVVIVDDQPEVAMDEENFLFDADNGFQEVRSKKNVKEAAARHKVEEKAYQRDKERSKPRPLMQELRLPPRDCTGLGVNMKTPFERPRMSKLPPRLAKQRENNRLQKVAQQQHHDVNEMNSINQNISLFPIKDHSSAPPPVNAWDKPITGALRANSPGSNAGQGMQLGSLTNSENCGMDMNDQPHSGASSQRSTPNGEKAPGKLSRGEVGEKAVLDGTTPPVQTIIFENTNYKTSPSDMALKAKFSGHVKSKSHKMEDGTEVALGYKSDLTKPDSKGDPIQMPLTFSKEDGADMKLDFFESELSQLTDDKKGLGLPRSMHMTPGVQSTISPSTADLNFKIASVKKVWENVPAMPTVLEHSEDGNVTSTASSFTPTFGNPVDSGLDQSFGKPGDCQSGDDGSSLNSGEVIYSHSPGPQMQGNPNNYSGVVVSAVPSMVKNDPSATSSNVCKVKPQQQAVLAGGPSPIGHPGPLSPPPFNASNPTQGHINYQATLGGGAGQFGGISAIPSPPTVLYNSSQQMPTQGGLYGAFQIDGTPVIGGQARSQFSQFPPYNLSQGLGQTSAFNQQSMYLQTPHAPPSNAQDMYQSSLSQYRIQTPQGPFGQSQQLSNNPSTVLISSTSNSLMSASVKPSSQPIGAIGTKGGVPYQASSMPTSAQPSPMYIQYDPSQVMNPSYLSGSQLVQRSGPVQNNVVPTIQPSSSYYSGSGGQGGFYQTSSSLQAVQQPQPSQQLHQTAGSPYGLQGYATQSGNGLQGFGSQFLSSQLQMAQGYRSAGLPAPPTYLKSAGQHMTDHGAASNGRSQLKSPSSNEAVLQSVFSTGAYPPQIPSPKSRSNMSKQQQQPLQQQQQQQQQQSPTQQHHKFSPYQSVSQTTQMAYQQNVRGQMNMGGNPRGAASGMSQPPPRYPSPIQRPVTYQQGGQQQQPNANMMGGRHRPQHPPTARPTPNINKMQNFYSSGHGGNLKMDPSAEGKLDSGTELKMSDVTSGNANPTSTKQSTSGVSTTDSKMTDTGKEDISAPTSE